MFIAGLSYAIDIKASHYLVSAFRTQIYLDKYTPISNIFDLELCNSILQETYGLIIVDETKLQSHILKYMKSQIHTNMSVNASAGYAQKDMLRYQHLIQSLHFSRPFVLSATKWVNNVLSSSPSRRMHVIHLRLEDDAVAHLSKNRRGMGIDAVKEIIENTYISNIKKHINKEDVVVVLTGQTNNKVMTYLRREKYNVKLPPKLSSFREINALGDMIVGKMCNGVFVGSGWSTFSQMLSHYLKNDERVHCKMLQYNFVN